MKLDLNDLLYSLSYALDCVEAEIFGVNPYHSERVAYLCVQLGKAYHYSEQDLLNLAAAAALHDNALTEYIAVRRTQMDEPTDEATNLPTAELLKIHCEMGEKNATVLPFYDKIKNAILYHHESADGTGPFGKKHTETSQMAQFIHLADLLDNVFDLTDVTDEMYQKIHNYLEKYKDVLFCPDLVASCNKTFPKPIHTLLKGEAPRKLIHKEFPLHLQEYGDDAIIGLATMFAKVVDYKSHFTCAHSLGIAQKAQKMGEYYKYDKDTCTKLYLAGALHDIGKLTISNDILEKPDKLTKEEFEVMKGHAKASWDILGRMANMEEIQSWAALHHEKLNGKGYPFHMTGKDLNKQERLLCCIDIYQALTESRPYKDGFNHAKTMDIMNGMVAKGEIDKDITHDLDVCFGT